MNTMKLKIATQDYVIYFYIPEGKGEAGEIRMEYSKEKADVISLAEEDNSAGHYAAKASNAVKERVSKGIFPLEFTNAWH